MSEDVNEREFAARLLAVRDGAPALQNIPREFEPSDIAHAYRVADLIVAALEPQWGPVTGYKVGATSLHGQTLLGLTDPFYGRVFQRSILTSGARWHLGGRPCTVEAEVGFLIATDLPPQANVYTMAALRTAIGAVVPLLEINRPAYARPFEVGGLCLVADNGVTQGVVVGAPGLALKSVPDLPGEAVTLSRNGCIDATGSARAVLDDPLNAVLWLANTLRAHGSGLRIGDVVASGAMTPHLPLMAGDRVIAEYSTLGSVSLEVGP